MALAPDLPPAPPPDDPPPAVAAHSRWPARLELVAGLGMCLAGGTQAIAELGDDFKAMTPQAHHGLALAGLFLVLRALADLGVNLHKGGALAHHHGLTDRLRAWVRSPRVEAAVGLLVMVASLGQIVVVEQTAPPAMWHWGLLLIGFTMACRVCYAAVDGFEYLTHGHLPGWLAPVARFVEAPAFQLVLAIGILALGLGELVAPTVFIPVQATAGLTGAHATAAFAAMRVFQSGRDLWSGFALVRAVRARTAAGGN